MLRRVIERVLDALTVLIFGPITDDVYEAEWDLHDAEQQVIAGCTQLCREAAEEEAS